MRSRKGILKLTVKQKLQLGGIGLYMSLKGWAIQPVLQDHICSRAIPRFWRIRCIVSCIAIRLKVVERWFPVHGKRPSDELESL